MVQYRKSQKEFALPLALLRGAVKAKNLLGGALNIASQGSMIAGTMQGAKGNKLMQQQNAEMERANREQQKAEQQRLKQEKEWQDRQFKLQQQALKRGVNPFGDSSILNNTAGSPTTPLQPPPAIFQKAASEETKKQKDFSVFSFAKDMSLLAARNKGIFINGILAGASTTAGIAVANKAILNDKEAREKRADDDKDEEERSYSKTRISFRAPVFSFALGASAPLIGYAAERKLEEDMIQDTYPEEEIEEEHVVVINNKKPSKFKEKSFGVPVKGVGKVLNAVSIMSGGGGARGMRSLGIKISALGKKSGNKATKKLGRAILNNPNVSMALSIPGGLAVFSGTFAIGDKIATNIAKKINPDSFEYTESKNKEVKDND